MRSSARNMLSIKLIAFLQVLAFGLGTVAAQADNTAKNDACQTRVGQGDIAQGLAGIFDDVCKGTVGCFEDGNQQAVQGCKHCKVRFDFNFDQKYSAYPICPEGYRVEQYRNFQATGSLGGGTTPTVTPVSGGQSPAPAPGNGNTGLPSAGSPTPSPVPPAGSSAGAGSPSPAATSNQGSGSSAGVSTPSPGNPSSNPTPPKSTTDAGALANSPTTTSGVSTTNKNAAGGGSAKFETWQIVMIVLSALAAVGLILWAVVIYRRKKAGPTNFVDVATPKGPILPYRNSTMPPGESMASRNTLSPLERPYGTLVPLESYVESTYAHTLAPPSELQGQQPQRARGPRRRSIEF